MIDWTRPVVRRDGKKARAVCMDVDNGGGSDRRPVLVLVRETSREYPTCYHASGCHFGGAYADDDEEPPEHGHDIVNMTEDWAVMYLADQGYVLDHCKNWQAPSKDLPNDEQNAAVLYLMEKYGYGGTCEGEGDD